MWNCQSYIAPTLADPQDRMSLDHRAVALSPEGPHDCHFDDDAENFRRKARNRGQQCALALEMCAEGALSVAKVLKVPLGALYFEVEFPEGLLLSSNGMSYGGRLVLGREYTSMDEFYRN